MHFRAPSIDPGVMAFIWALLLSAYVYFGLLAVGASAAFAFVIAVLSFAGGIFIPLDQMGHTFATNAKFSTVYGVGEIARAPLTGSGFTVTAFVNVIVWTALFAGGAIWRFRRDTSRV